jgi:hypothetical protein
MRLVAFGDVSAKKMKEALWSLLLVTPNLEHLN